MHLTSGNDVLNGICIVVITFPNEESITMNPKSLSLGIFSCHPNDTILCGKDSFYLQLSNTVFESV